MNIHEQFFDKKKQELGVVLNTVQKQAVLQTEGPLLLLASPGSGKTTTIIMRIGYLIEVKGVRPERIKAVTFSKASALDMKDRFQKYFPYLPMVDFSTIHSLAFQIVRDYFGQNHIDYNLIEGNQNRAGITKNTLLRQIYKEVNKELITEDQLEELTTYISYVKNKMLPRDQWDIKSCKVTNKVEILEKYEGFKMSNPILLIDFDDMLIRANQILTVNQPMLAHYQQQYDYVLTDESQDTSMVQHAIIENLVAQHQNLCVVADEDQSIYSWRGAEPGYLLDFKKVYPEAAILMMVQNYRSSANIVNIANEFIKQNKQRYDKNMVTENPPSQPIQLTTLGNYRLQQQYLVDCIKQVSDFSAIAILYRNNSSVIPLMDMFDQHHIPFYMKDVEHRFFKHWIVEDVLNILRLSFDEKRIDIFEKIYLKLDAYLSKAQFEQLANSHNNESVFDCLLKGNILKDYQKKKITLYKKIVNTLKEEKPYVAIQKIRNQLGYEKMLKNRAEKFGYNFDNLMDILNTLGMIAKPLDTVIFFANRLKHLEAAAANSQGNKGKNAVTFSTMHSSKGLEFETVFVIDLIDGVIPSVKLEEETAQEYEEEIRLFYVAMTRAKANLECITYTSRFDNKVDISKFFTDIKQLVHPETKSVTATKQKVKVDRQLSPNAIQDPSLFEVGLSIHHQVFGEGKIVSIRGNIISIQFLEQIKKFDVSTCIKYGLLEKV